MLFIFLLPATLMVQHTNNSMYFHEIAKEKIIIPCLKFFYQFLICIYHPRLQETILTNARVMILINSNTNVYLDIIILFHPLLFLVLDIV